MKPVTSKRLRQYAVLDTAPEQELDDLTELAAQICGTPIAAISLVDEHRQWFKARVGLGVRQTPRDVAFCAHTLHQQGLFIVPDAKQDERFATNPLVISEPGICFYAGAPLVTPENVTLGALCVIDHHPRTLTPAQEQALRVLCRQVMTHLELRRHMRDLLESEERLRIVTDNAHVGLVIVNQERRYIYANNAYAKTLALPCSAIVGRHLMEVLPGIYEEQIRPHLDRAFGGERVSYDLRSETVGGDRHYAITYEPTVVNGTVTLVVAVITDITASREPRNKCASATSALKLWLAPPTKRSGIGISTPGLCGGMKDTGRCLDILRPRPIRLSTLGPGSFTLRT